MAERAFTITSFNQYLGEKKLMAAQCQSCGQLHLPPRPLCSRCHSQEIVWVEMAGVGELAAFTSIAVVPSFMRQEGYGRDNPYVTGIVALAEGPRISARILGVNAREPEGIRVGIPLQVEFLDVPHEEVMRTVLAFRAQGEGF